MSDIDEIVSSATHEVAEAHALAELDAVRVRYLGKKGLLTGLLKSLGDLPSEQRPQAGQLINVAKTTVSNSLDERKLQLEAAQLEANLSGARLDVTLPGRGTAVGRAHPGALKSATGPRLRTTIITSRRLTSRRTILLAQCMTRFILATGRF
jgi:phenylalanyl-tRNA synthetase alpha chain